MKRKFLKYILPIMIIAALSQVSCFDTYNDIMANSGERYKLAVVGTTISITDSMIYFSDNKGGLEGPEIINTNANECIKSEFADFNMDGNLDLLFIRQDNYHMMYFSDGKGNFTQGGTGIENAGGLSQDSAITDIDNDGDPDIVIARTAPGDYILINNGSGDFTFNDTLIPVHQSNQVIAADFDMDGDNDLLFATSAGKELWLNNSGTFTLASAALGAGYIVTEMVSADFDSDGDTDLIEVTLTNGPALWLNNGSGNFTQGWNDPALNTMHYDITIADIDSDGDFDCYISTFSLADDFLLINNGNGNFSVNNFNKGAFDNTYAAEFADIDMDGDIDLITSAASQLRIYHNDGFGELKLYKSYAPIPIQSNISVGAIFQ